MIKELKTGQERAAYSAPEAEIVSFHKEGSVMASSGEETPDEPTPGF